MRPSTSLQLAQAQNTPLLFAAQRGHAIVARLLLDAGADVDARDEVSGRAAGGRGAAARAGLWHPPSRFAPCRMATRRS